jgi:hypothetical protein
MSVIHSMRPVQRFSYVARVLPHNARETHLLLLCYFKNAREFTSRLLVYLLLNNHGLVLGVLAFFITR